MAGRIILLPDPSLGTWHHATQDDVPDPIVLSNQHKGADVVTIINSGLHTEQGSSRRSRRRLKMLSALSGRRCIYKEGGLICVVRVTRSDLTQAGIFLHLEVLRWLTGNGPEEFMVGASHDSLRVSRNWSLAASWVNWILVVRGDLVRQIEEAGNGCDPGTLMRLVNKHS